MARRHQHHARIVTRFVRIPEELPDGKVRCNGCGAVVSVTKNGRTRVHKTPAGEPCAYVVAGYATPVQLAELPSVVLPPVPIAPPAEGRRREKREQPPKAASRLDSGSECQDCGRWLPGERSVCGRCYLRRDKDRGGKA